MVRRCSAQPLYRKRRKLRRAEIIQSLTADSPSYKRRYSMENKAMFSIMASFLDITDKDVEAWVRTLSSPKLALQDCRRH